MEQKVKFTVEKIGKYQDRDLVRMLFKMNDMMVVKRFAIVIEGTRVGLASLNELPIDEDAIIPFDFDRAENLIKCIKERRNGCDLPLSLAVSGESLIAERFYFHLPHLTLELLDTEIYIPINDHTLPKIIKFLEDLITIVKAERPPVTDIPLRWSQDELQKAGNDHYYLEIGPKADFPIGSGPVGRLLLIDAPKRWENPETAGDVYVPSLRVAGYPVIIRQMFIRMGVPAEQIDQHLAHAYTAANYNTTMKHNFDSEVAAYKEYKVLKERHGFVLPTLRNI